MPEWGWWLVLVLLVGLGVAGLIALILRAAHRGFEIWWEEENGHPDAAMISTFPDRGLEG